MTFRFHRKTHRRLQHAPLACALIGVAVHGQSAAAGGLNAEPLSLTPGQAAASQIFGRDGAAVMAGEAAVFELAQAATVDDLGEIPEGYHVMSDGTLMANSPSRAVAPPGYHLMPDGTLMADGAAGDSTAGAGHGTGMWMFEYQFQRMEMEGLLDQSNEVSALRAVDPAGPYGFMMAPTDMTMDMHMFMLMYHTHSYMFMAMAHYMTNEMGMLSNDGTVSTMESEGFADTVVTATFPLPYHLSFMAGLSIPTGDIDVRGPMTHSAAFTEANVKYPYGMQLGSGTYDLLHGLSYESMFNDGRQAWGASYEYTLRIGENDNDYTLGDRLLMDAWTRWTLSPMVSAKAALNAWLQDDIDGFDADIQRNIAMSPTADPDAYGGRRLDASLGVRYETPQMTSLGLAYAVPVYQDLNGLQMKTESIWTLSFGFMF